MIIFIEVIFLVRGIRLTLIAFMYFIIFELVFIHFRTLILLPFTPIII